jgi:hypothetical protein
LDLWIFARAIVTQMTIVKVLYSVFSVMAASQQLYQDALDHLDCILTIALRRPRRTNMSDVTKATPWIGHMATKRALLQGFKVVAMLVRLVATNISVLSAPMPLVQNSTVSAAMEQTP